MAASRRPVSKRSLVALVAPHQVVDRGPLRGRLLDRVGEQHGAEPERLVLLAQAGQRVAVALADPPAVPGGGRRAVGFGDPEPQPAALQRRGGELAAGRPCTSSAPRRSRRGLASARRGGGRRCRSRRRAARASAGHPEGEAVLAFELAPAPAELAAEVAAAARQIALVAASSNAMNGRTSVRRGRAGAIEPPCLVPRAPAANRFRRRPGRGAAAPRRPVRARRSAAQAAAIAGSSAASQAGVNQSPRRAPAKRRRLNIHRLTRTRGSTPRSSPSQRQAIANGSSAGFARSQARYHSGVRNGFERSSARRRQVRSRSSPGSVSPINSAWPSSRTRRVYEAVRICPVRPWRHKFSPAFSGRMFD